jgi:serine/threonine-protein kinase
MWARGELVAGRYRLDGILTEGGSGTVYRASDVRAAREVALKAIRRVALAPEDFARGFAEEAARALALEHPHVARLFDHGFAEDGTPFLVHELCAGQTLADLLRTRGALPPERVARIAAQTLAALADAHGRGLCHRDLRPAKLLLVDRPDGDDFVKVLGFGVREAAADRQAALSRDGAAFGDPSYFAPEQVHGVGVGPPTDLYALGLVMGEALSGRVLVKAASTEQTAMEQASDKPVALPPQVLQSPLGAIVLRATYKALDRRFGSAKEMLEEVRASGAARPTTEPGSLGSAQTATMPAVADGRPSAIPIERVPSPQHVPPHAGYAAQPTPPLGYAPQPTPPFGYGAPGIGAQPLPPSMAGRAPVAAPRRGAGGGLLLALLIGGGLLLLLGVVGVVIWLRMEGSKPVAAGDAAATSAPAEPGRPPLSSFDEPLLRRLLADDGWTVSQVTTTDGGTFSLLVFQLQRKDGGGVVQLYKYKDATLATTMTKQLESNRSGAASRDGRTILFIVVNRVGGDPRATSRALLATLTGASPER